MGFAQKLRGSIVALPSFFTGDRLDVKSFAALIERQIAGGTNGLVVAGSTGEGQALGAGERELLLVIAFQVAKGRAPVIAGCTAPSTRLAEEMAHEATGVGAAGLLCSPPPYSKPTQEGIFAHIRAIAHVSDLPVILYDVPARTGVRVADETVARLFDAGLIMALKDATGDLSRPGRLRALCGSGLVQLSGDDATAAAHRATGGAGCVSVVANLAPKLCSILHAAWDRGDVDTFERMRDLLAPLVEALGLESNPIPLKAALAELGIGDGRMRLPLTRATNETVSRIAAALPKVMVAESQMLRRSQYFLAG